MDVSWSVYQNLSLSLSLSLHKIMETKWDKNVDDGRGVLVRYIISVSFTIHRGNQWLSNANCRYEMHNLFPWANQSGTWYNNESIDYAHESVISNLSHPSWVIQIKPQTSGYTRVFLNDHLNPWGTQQLFQASLSDPGFDASGAVGGCCSGSNGRLRAWQRGLRRRTAGITTSNTMKRVKLKHVTTKCKNRCFLTGACWFHWF